MYACVSAPDPACNDDAGTCACGMDGQDAGTCRNVGGCSAVAAAASGQSVTCCPGLRVTAK
jgi:hypothetical protein